MLEKTFHKLGEMFEAMSVEIKDAIKDARANGKNLDVVVTNGDIAITGEFKSLRINGRLVSFAKDKKK